MNYGFHLSAQGARAQSTKLEVIANNLANAGTTAFKKALAVFQDNRPYDLENGASTEPPGDLNQSTGGITLAEIVTDHGQGSLLETGGKLDVAIHGPGYYQVADTQGKRFLTRNGRFSINADGELLASSGRHRVLGPDGDALKINPAGGEVTIGPDGTISQGGSEVGRLGLFVPGSTAELEARGDSLYVASGPVDAAPMGTKGAQIKQGFLEASGTNSIHEMMSLIEASRAFESNVNMIRYQDESMAQLLRSLSRR